MKACTLGIVISSILFSGFLTVSAERIDQVAAVVNDEIITETDVEYILSPLFAKYRNTLTGSELAEKMQQAREDALHQLIDRKLIVQEAHKKELHVDESLIEEKIDEVRKKFPSEKEFQAALESDSLSLADMKEKISEQLLVQKISKEEVVAKVVVSPKEIQEYYDSHPEEFNDEETVQISHILIKKGDDEDKAEKARMVLDKLHAGEAFDVLAREYSDGPNAHKGGDLGFISRGQMLPAIEEQAFTLKVGEFSEIIETDLGYHIIQVHVRKEKRIIPLLEVWSDIKNILFQEKAMAAHKEWVKKLRSKAYIVVM